MKKILTTLIGLAAGAALVHAQGYIDWDTTAFGVTTNGATSGKTFTYAQGGNAYDYTLLFIAAGAVTNAGDELASDSDWIQLVGDGEGFTGDAAFATNTTGVTGNFQGMNGAQGQQFIGAGSQAFANLTTYYVMLIGWSVSLGSSWTTVLSEYEAGFASDSGYFGYEIGSVDPSSSATGTTFAAIFGNNTLVLNAVPVPEPTTLALAGLGGLSLLFLRRRKS